jgi:hypothetical protein
MFGGKIDVPITVKDSQRMMVRVEMRETGVGVIYRNLRSMEYRLTLHTCCTFDSE